MKKYGGFISLLIVFGGIYLGYYTLMPQTFHKQSAPSEQFATERALVHVKKISQKPHYMGAPYHKEVQRYLVDELEKVGLDVTLQEEYLLDAYRAYSKPQNVLARIKGTGDGTALLLLAHYDSSPHSSLGASDDASGVATILEGLRAFIASGSAPKNDIIVLFSDGEELELSGAGLFLKSHPWAQQVKLVLNFEARGSGGPSYMFMETNGGNAKLVEAFKKAHVPFPVATSLAYSIYKMLPNDTDLTVFRKDADIDGFNFAFIDDHYDYHTALDSYENLDRNSLEHQGAYLMPLLRYFASADLKELKSSNDNVYFNTFLGLHRYPFSWALPMLLVAFIAFGYICYSGFKNKVLALKSVLKGFAVFLACLAASAAIAHYGWGLLLKLYPSYREILQGFTYNGHSYIAAIAFLTLGICWLCYSFLKTRQETANYMVAPLFVWLLINTGIVMKLKGAAFFIIPLYIGLFLLYGTIRQRGSYPILYSIITLPVWLVMAPFIQMLPVALGLKMLIASAALVTLLFGVALPVLGLYSSKKTLVLICFSIAAFFIVKAHIESRFTESKPRPNSLVYFLDADKGEAFWGTYDYLPDTWTEKKIGKNQKPWTATNTHAPLSQYGRRFTYVTRTTVKNIAPPLVEVLKDTLVENKRVIKARITSQRPVNYLQLFTDNAASISSFSVDGQFLRASSLEEMKRNSEKQLLNYCVSEAKPIEIAIMFRKGDTVSIELKEISFDLLEQQSMEVSPRPAGMIPKPFVRNDAILVKKRMVF